VGARISDARLAVEAVAVLGTVVKAVDEDEDNGVEFLASSNDDAETEVDGKAAERGGSGSERR
jgi:hypothetical protein